MLYDSPTKVEIPTFIPMLTSSIDAVEKLRAWGRPKWKIDGLQAKNGEYIVRATSESGATVQAAASTEVRARLVTVLHAFQGQGLSGHNARLIDHKLDGSDDERRNGD